MIENREALEREQQAYGQALQAQKRKILVCAGTGCVAGGSLQIYDELVRLLADRKVPCDVELTKEPHGDTVGVKKSGCHGFCEGAGGDPLL